MKFEFWRTFRVAQPYKSAPKFKFQKEFPLQGRNFVAKMGDENFSGQHTKSFRDKATFTKTISTDEFTKLFQGRRLSESLFESKTVAKRDIYEESVPY